MKFSRTPRRSRPSGLRQLKRQNPLLYFLITLGIAVFAYVQAPQGSVHVIDGDTLELHGERIRLFGIDAPELKQTCRRDGQTWACGQAARQALAEKIGSHDIRCVPQDHDTYGRTVSECFLDGESLNGWMVRHGWALAYRRYSLEYVPAELAASRDKAGLWQGRFEKPWVWRHARRSE